MSVLPPALTLPVNLTLPLFQLDIFLVDCPPQILEGLSGQAEEAFPDPRWNKSRFFRQLSEGAL
jgi:hypothetical protein